MDAVRTYIAWTSSASRNRMERQLEHFVLGAQKCYGAWLKYLVVLVTSRMLSLATQTHWLAFSCCLVCKCYWCCYFNFALENLKFCWLKWQLITIVNKTSSLFKVCWELYKQWGERIHGSSKLFLPSLVIRKAKYLQLITGRRSTRREARLRGLFVTSAGV